MNITISANLTGPILCPIEGRRTSTELYVKLIVVHFTTITAFCHLLSITDEPLLSFKPLFFFFTPLNIIVQYAAPLLAILGWIIYSMIKNVINPSTPIASPKSSFQWLFGRLPDRHDAGGTYSTLPTANRSRSSSNGSAGNSSAASTPRLTAKVLGRVIVLAAFLAQCVGTLFLYVRRQRQDAVTLVDRKIFELACGGILVAILSIAVIIKVPLFVKMVPDTIRSVVDKVVAFCRCRSHSKFDPALDKTLFEDPFQLMKLGGLSFLTIIMCGKYALLEPLRNFFNGSLFTHAAFFEGSLEEAVFTLLFIFGTMSALLYLPQSRRSEEGGNWLPWVIICPCTAPAFIALYYFMLGAVPVVGVVLRDYVRLFTQISILKNWPEDAACPLSWKDPLSEYVWWLA